MTNCIEVAAQDRSDWCRWFTFRHAEFLVPRKSNRYPPMW